MSQIKKPFWLFLAALWILVSFIHAANSQEAVIEDFKNVEKWKVFDAYSKGSISRTKIEQTDGPVQGEEALKISVYFDSEGNDVAAIGTTGAWDLSRFNRFKTFIKGGKGITSLTLVFKDFFERTAELNIGPGGEKKLLSLEKWTEVVFDRISSPIVTAQAPIDWSKITSILIVLSDGEGFCENRPTLCNAKVLLGPIRAVAEPGLGQWPIPYFSPDGDGGNDLTFIPVFLPETDEASVTILDSKDAEVRTLKHSFKGLYRFEWDGKDENGAVVPDGIYTIHAQARGLDEKRTVEALVAPYAARREREKTAREKIAQTGSFRFALIGDSRSNPETYGILIQGIKDHDADFILNSGDLVLSGDNLDYWATQWFPVDRNIDVPYYPILGNHDSKGPKSMELYKFLMANPGNELYYSYQYGDALFVALNSEEDGSGGRISGEQMQWLKDTVSGAGAKYVFVYIHRPLYVKDCFGHKTDALYADQEYINAFAKTLKDLGVTGYFAGHEHVYDRIEKDGLLHIVAGGGGANLNTTCPGGWHQYVIFDVTQNGISGKVYDKDGNVRDSFEIK